MKPQKVLCAQCGNPRLMMLNECPFCGDTKTLDSLSSQKSTYVINLEVNMPTVEDAMDRFQDHLDLIKGKSIRMVKVIHGHGSTGSGGKIRHAFRQAMDYGLWGESIIEVYYGEVLSPHHLELKNLVERYPSLKQSITRDMQGNPGITLLIIDKNY
jgi:hypothetical protein